MNNIKNLSLFGVCFAFVVIALGAWTRLVDAGLGCPDWPGCYGFVVFQLMLQKLRLLRADIQPFLMI
jgi:heme A synthase